VAAGAVADAGVTADVASTAAGALSIFATRFIVTASAVGSGAPSISLAMVCTVIVSASIFVMTCVPEASRPSGSVSTLRTIHSAPFLDQFHSPNEPSELNVRERICFWAGPSR
jgi:hypothetical protein